LTGADDQPGVAVIVFPGSNDHEDAALALEGLGANAMLVWHAEATLPDVHAVVLPGGFSYGDYLRCGAIARFSPVMAAVGEFADRGGPVLGICNGFQILCEASLLPGALQANASLRFVARDVAVRVERADLPFTSRCEAGERLVLPVKHGEGRYVAPPGLLEELEQQRQIVLRYETGENPNGADDDIAGVVNPQGNVMGLMPHPEHAVDSLLGSADGARILGSLVDSARERARLAGVGARG
jgi:phosphoribosylformylglycinamidine synthase